MYLGFILKEMKDYWILLNMLVDFFVLGFKENLYEFIKKENL